MTYYPVFEIFQFFFIFKIWITVEYVMEMDPSFNWEGCKPVNAKKLITKI